MNKIIPISILLVINFILSSCEISPGGAPVVEKSISNEPPAEYYRVSSSDTLYSIAWAFQLDYRELIELNQLRPPYHLHLGQILRIKPPTRIKHARYPAQPARIVRVRVIQKPLMIRPTDHAAQQRAEVFSAHPWHWPASGKLVELFSQQPFAQKGISISGRLGEPVTAAANGVVVYSGAGVRGYGNLILIKHSESYLSAYAFNQRNLVKDGDRVIVGQKIAEMGQDNAGHILLYFEIRQNGKPVNPLPYLRNQ